MIFKKIFIFIKLLLYALLFFVIFILAIKNRELVTLRFFLDYQWDAPLSLVLATALIFGALLGLTSGLVAGYVIMKKREKANKKKFNKQFELMREKATGDSSTTKALPAPTPK